MKNRIIYSALCLLDIAIIASWFQPSDSEERLAFFPLLISAAFGIFQAVSSYSAAQDQADMVEEEAKINAEADRLNAEAEAAEETAEVKRMREEQRRRKATIEAGYAKSGVLIDGTPSEMLAKQAETDEYNVQTVHHEGNERRKINKWQSDANYQMGMHKADSYRSQANTSLVAGLGSTAANVYGMQSKAKYSSFKWY